jgi:MFS family permease
MRKEEIEKQKALKISIKEGTAASASSGFGDSFIIPFAQLIGSNALHIGLISAFSGLLSPIAQRFSNKLMEKHSRKAIVRKFVFYQSIIWIPIVILSILSWKNIVPSILPWLLIVLYSLMSIFGGLSYAPWFSWMGDIVPEKERGKYFSKRNVYTGAVGIIVAIIASLVVKRFESLNIAFLGFTIIFLLAFIFKGASFSEFKKQYEPKFRLKKESEFSFFSFLKRYDNYGKFAVYQAFFNFAIMIASPFFGFYMLTELGLNNNLVLFTIISISTSFFSLLFFPLAGKFSDKYGNLKLMYISNAFFVLTPLLWIFSKNPIYLMLIPGISSGIANAALLGVNNFTYDSVSQKSRGTCIAYTNILIGIGVFLGSLLGGILLKYLNFLGASSFFAVFVLASLARLAVALIFLPKLKEVKRVRKISLRTIHPLKTINQEVHGLGTFTHHLENSLEKEVKTLNKRALLNYS